MKWTRKLLESIFLCPIFQDFGDHSDQYYSVQTQEGEQIAALIAGYIDIIFLSRPIFQDFGDHSDQYYSLQTQEGEQIAALIA